jgi:hypothetical protein
MLCKAISNVMRKTPAKIVVPLAAIITLALILSQGCSPDRGFNAAQLARFKAQFESDDTNAPLLTMDWLSGPRSDEFCRVSRNGTVMSARDVRNWAIQGGHRASLDTANRFLLVQAINGLPLQSKPSLPQDRQLIVAGIRSNQWFECFYDRADVPWEVERLYEITGAHLEWFIPEVEGRHMVHSDNGPERGSQSVINSFSVAKDAPIAVSTGVDGLQIWTLSGSSAGAILPLDKTPYRTDLWSIAALTPDGRIVIFTGEGTGSKTIYAFAWQKKDLLWEHSQVDVGNTYEAGDKTFAVGNHGRSLFVSVANGVEHWDLATGNKVATLATNQTGVKFMRTSWDGTILVVGFGDNSFMVWKTDKDEPVFEFSEPEPLAGTAVSPDGRKILLSTRENQSKWILWDSQEKTRDEFPSRLPRASLSAPFMYWSPDGKWLAANVDTYPYSIVIYETITWKPVAHWPCGKIMSAARFGFRNDGVFLELMDHDISGLDLTKSEGATENKAAELNVSKPDNTTPPTAPVGDKDFQTFQEKIKETVDPIRLQNLAIPILEHGQSPSDWGPFGDNAEFFQEARHVYGFVQTTVEFGTNHTAWSNPSPEYAKTHNTGGKPEYIVIFCAVKDSPRMRGLVVGETNFAGPKWDRHRQLVHWKYGIYFWNDTSETPP